MAEESKEKTADEIEQETTPEKKEQAPDPYTDTPEEYREICRETDKLLMQDLTPMDRLKVTEIARRAEHLVNTGRLTKEELMGMTTNEPEKPKPEPKPKEKASSSNPLEERLERLEQLLTSEKEQRETERKQRESAENEDKFNRAVESELDAVGVKESHLREALTNQFIGHFLRMKNKPGPERYAAEVKKFLANEVEKAKSASDEERSTYILAKYAQAEKTETETTGTGAAPTKRELKLTPTEAKDPRAVADAIKRKRGIA